MKKENKKKLIWAIVGVATTILIFFSGYRFYHYKNKVVVEQHKTKLIEYQLEIKELKKEIEKLNDILTSKDSDILEHKTNIESLKEELKNQKNKKDEKVDILDDYDINTVFLELSEIYGNDK